MDAESPTKIYDTDHLSKYITGVHQFQLALHNFSGSLASVLGDADPPAFRRSLQLPHYLIFRELKHLQDILKTKAAVL